MDDDPFDDLEDEALLKAAAQEESSLTEAQVYQRLCSCSMYYVIEYRRRPNAKEKQRYLKEILK